MNAILSTSDATSAAPVRPSPVTTLTTPAGRPTSRQRSAKASAVSDVYSAGFSTTALPIASAGATFHDSSSSGKFHATICPHTPSGTRPGATCAMSCAWPAWW